MASDFFLAWHTDTYYLSDIDSMINRNLTALFSTQLLGMMAYIMMLFIAGLAGLIIAPSKTLATLPAGTLLIGSALAAYPSASLMKWLGRKTGSLLAILVAIVGAIIAIAALIKMNFWLFCFGALLVGVNTAFVQQYRFAIIEGLALKKQATAVSLLVFANAFSALFGTTLAQVGKSTFSTIFLGSMFGVIACLVISFLTLLCYYPPKSVHESTIPAHCINPKNKVPAMAIGALGYFMMTWVMFAMPTSMHTMGPFTISQAGFVMQSHLLAMFLPSLITGYLAKKWGNITIVFLGCIALAISLTCNLTGMGFYHYWTGLVMLGIGWNFTFIAGTTILTQSYQHKDRFKVQGINDLFVFSANAIASLSASFSVLTLGWVHLNCFAAIILALIFCMVLWIKINQR